MTTTRKTVRVFVRPTGLHSRAMIRIADALTKYAPREVEIVNGESDDRDLEVLYVIGPDAIDYCADMRARGRRYAIVQCCLRTAGLSRENAHLWCQLWHGAASVWSYYDISRAFREIFNTAPPPFNDSVTMTPIYAPLGIDPAFVCGSPVFPSARERYVVTTGTVSGRGAEPIEEVWIAAHRTGDRIVHVGPEPVGLSACCPRDHVTYAQGISDDHLADIYRRASFVSGLRWVEGFELPAAEAIGCGTRPIMFDRPDTVQWFGRHVPVLIDESDNRSTVIDQIEGALSHCAVGMNPSMMISRQVIVECMDWRQLCASFWSAILEGVQ